MRISAAFVLVTIAAATPGEGCTIFYPTVPVGPNFRVRVADQERPVANLRVVIAGGNRLITAATDRDGFSVFRGVPPGSYHLSASHDGGMPDGAELEVRHDGPINVTIPLKWPSVQRALVRFLKGFIHGPDYLPGQAQPRLSLELVDGTSGRTLKAVETNELGAFDLAGTPPGRYFLTLKGVGRILVTVDRHAPKQQLDLAFGWSSCGPFYADQSRCGQDELPMRHLAGEVVDSGGGAIPDSKIHLLDASGRLVEQWQSDDKGRFDSGRPFVGTYQLVVSRAGFTTHRRTLVMNPGFEGRSALTVKLGVMGGCSVSDVP